MADNSVIARVRALLERTTAAGCTEEEAAAAASAAERLLRRHNLEMRDVRRPDIVGLDTGQRYLDPWARSLGVHAARYYGCEPLVVHVPYVRPSRRPGMPDRRDTYRSLRFYGREAAVTVAVEMYMYLWQTVIRLSRDYSPARAEQLGFQRGAGERLAHRLWELREEQTRRAETQEGRSDGTSLVVVEQSEALEHIRASMTTSQVRRTTSDTSGRAAHDGWRAGGDIGLAPQVAGARGPQAIGRQ